MKKLTLLVCLLSITIMNCVFAKTTTVNFSPSAATYTNMVQDIAVYQEACQNKSSGHYVSKMYEFAFHHDANNDCVVDGSTGSLMFKVVLDDDANHVVKTMLGTNGRSAEYDLHMKTTDNDDFYAGTVTLKK